MGSCTSCKYCTQIGSDDEGNAVKRRCTHHMKSYEDYVEYDCRYYIYESPYSSSSSSSSSSSASSSDSRKEHKYLKRFVILLIILAFIFVGFSRVLHFIATNHNTSVTTTDSPQIIPDTEDSDIKQPQLSTAPNAESTSTEETISSAVLKACGTATVTPIEGLNLRVGPAISYRRILVMGQYETVTVFYITNNWAYVDYGGTKGWCSCDWLDLSNVTFVEETADRNDTYYVENPDGIELLLGRYNGAPVIVYIGVFSEVILLRIDGDYAYVDYNGYKGWCYLDQLTVTVPESEATVYLNEDATVSGSSEVAIYSSNSTSSSTITQIEEGATVIILIIDGNWAYIDFSGNKGWCQLSYLIRDEEIITEKTTNSTTTENTKNNIENNQNKDEADKLLDEFISNYYASSTVHQNNNNNNDNNGKTALDMEIDIAIIDSQLIKDSYRGKPVNGRTEMTKDEVLDFYLEVDKLCKITENSPPGVFDDQYEPLYYNNMPMYVRVADNEMKTFEDVCEKYYSCLSDELADEHMNCFEYNGNIYTLNGGKGPGILKSDKRYNVVEENDGFSIYVESDIYGSNSTDDFIRTDKATIRIEKEDGVWVVTQYSFIY